ncbi:MAG: hypothetical protein WA637_03625 [Terriglobales bacterium]
MGTTPPQLPPNFAPFVQTAIDTLRQEFQNDRVDRSTRTMERMRNWMMFYTAFLTLFLTFFSLFLTGIGYLGYRGWTDIEANRKKVEQVSTESGKLLGEAQRNVDAIKGDDLEVKRLLEKDTKVLKDVGSAIDSFSGKVANLRSQTQELQGKQRQLTSEVEKSSAITSKFGSLIANRLSNPIITKAAMSGNTITIIGNNFGSAKRALASESVRPKCFSR